MSGAWVFGYGSLVSPASLARTIGRTVMSPDERLVAEVAGFGRRWNYGSMNLRGTWTHDGREITDGVVVSLGLAASDAETCNGVIVRVTHDELAALDWRERDYERTDVTEQVTIEATTDPDLLLDLPVVTFVPRPSAIERYEAARDAGRAAVRSSYWDLVAEAFDGLGGDHLGRFERTPRPDVPVVDVTITSS